MGASALWFYDDSIGIGDVDGDGRDDLVIGQAISVGNDTYTEAMIFKYNPEAQSVEDHNTLISTEFALFQIIPIPLTRQPPSPLPCRNRQPFNWISLT
ncbi:MAG: FG-GAP repeat protein [Calditrichae bacterium]|nr:FG-GAP repeat protein [Calditrichia bacterium]